MPPERIYKRIESKHLRDAGDHARWADGYTHLLEPCSTFRILGNKQAHRQSANWIIDMKHVMGPTISPDEQRHGKLCVAQIEADAPVHSNGSPPLSSHQNFSSPPPLLLLVADAATLPRPCRAAELSDCRGSGSGRGELRARARLQV